MNKLDRYMLAVGIFLIAFVAGMVAVYCVKGDVPNVLITAVFAICGFEGGMCGWIKNENERREDRKWKLEDEGRCENEQQGL